ncbi:MAG: serine/threonine protein kinase [Planctomycetaceae bacterium]|nr:serine/threonine protein kinase [Planctomycetaceae bacterium]MBT4887166.1 serine/threonine protein kinase [Planctomycetaceae bacterium]MBT6054419.1 serine/threonine protein kinase [Planctomycetaceae bacterium]MBT7728320.1 serine/threonine protein kinase [Planctomycetaceae bacterium]
MEEELSADAEERLAGLLEELTTGPVDQAHNRLEKLCLQNMDLARQLRELFATVSVTDAVAMESTIIMLDEHVDATSLAEDDSGSFRGDGFLPGASSLPVQFGEYELLEEIGRGGMGIVYRAVQKSLQRVVAVKMLLRRDLASQADLSRFRSEAEAAAQLDHPGIVSIFEVGEHDGHPFYSMRYIEGTTLSKRLEAGPIPPREGARILLRVAEAVQAAHARGVLHRDLKPSNILIDLAGKPHVSDFGLAKRLEGNQTMTHTGAILGTPCYMSPEQAAGSRGDVGPVSDVWSLGAILYQVLVDRPPFQASSPMATLLAVLEVDPPLPRSINGQVNRDLEMIALKTLQKPQDLRYASAADLANDLRAFLASEPIAARQGGVLDVVSRLLRETHHAVVLENWGLLWMWHSVVVLILSVITDVLAWQGVESRWPYVALWTGGLALWAPIFWALRYRAGPVTAVERQIAHIWGGTMIASMLLFSVEELLGLPVLKLSPVLALLAGLMFFAKAGILSGIFYIQSICLFVTGLVMCGLPQFQHILFGLVSGGCFFIPGLKYYRQLTESDR